jgi:hypothetical protein
MATGEGAHVARECEAVVDEGLAAGARTHVRLQVEALRRARYLTLVRELLRRSTVRKVSRR